MASNFKFSTTVLVEVLREGDWTYSAPEPDQTRVFKYYGMVFHKNCTNDHPKRYLNVNYIDIDCSCKFSVIEDMLASEFWDKVKFINGH